MQIHPGVLRDHHSGVAAAYGQDKGFDIPSAVEFTRALRPMLDAFGTDPRFRLIALHHRRDGLQPGAGPAGRRLPRAPARRALVVPRLPRAACGGSGSGHRDGRLLQHGRLRRRHPRLLLDPGPARPGPPDRRRLPGPAGRRAPARRGRGRRDRASTSPTTCPSSATSAADPSATPDRTLKDEETTMTTQLLAKDLARGRNAQTVRQGEARLRPRRLRQRLHVRPRAGLPAHVLHRRRRDARPLRPAASSSSPRSSTPSWTRSPAPTSTAAARSAGTAASRR